MEHLSDAFRRMVLMLIEDNNAIFTANNEIKVYADGREKFADLIAAIKGAHDHIHLEYYLWRNDGLSAEMGQRSLSAHEQESKSNSYATVLAARGYRDDFLMS